MEWKTMHWYLHQSFYYQKLQILDSPVFFRQMSYKANLFFTKMGFIWQNSSQDSLKISVEKEFTHLFLQLWKLTSDGKLQSVKDNFIKRNYSFSTYVKLSEKLTFLTPWYKHGRVITCYFAYLIKFLKGNKK